jgi:uncharacterized protein
MAGKTARKLFVNLPVRDLAASKRFFASLDFEFDARFTDESAACMIVAEDGYVVLLTEGFFGSFTGKGPCDTRTHVAESISLSCTSRAEVTTLVERAVAAGASRAGSSLDHGFMLVSGFHDLDGHQWQLTWRDPRTVHA